MTACCAGGQELVHPLRSVVPEWVVESIGVRCREISLSCVAPSAHEWKSKLVSVQDLH